MILCVILFGSDAECIFNRAHYENMPNANGIFYDCGAVRPHRNDNDFNGLPISISPADVSNYHSDNKCA